MKLSEIKEKLKTGDIERIANALEISVSLVRKVINGYRTSHSFNSNRIKIAAAILIERDKEFESIIKQIIKAKSRKEVA